MGGAHELVLHERCPLSSAARAVVTINILAAMRFVLIAPRTIDLTFLDLNFFF